VRELSRLEISLGGGSMLAELRTYLRVSSYSLTKSQIPPLLTSRLTEDFVGWLLKRGIAVQGLILPFSSWVRRSPWTPSPCPGAMLEYTEVVHTSYVQTNTLTI
jgi:hypothetical protein